MERLSLSGKVIVWTLVLTVEAGAALSLFILPQPWYALIIALLVPLGLLLWAKPLLGIVVLVFFLPNYGVDLLPIAGKADLHFIDLAVALACLSWVIHCIKERRLRVTFSALDLPIFALFLWVGMSMLWAPGLFRSVQQILKIIVVLVGYFMTVQMVNSKKDLRWVIGAWLGLAFIVTVTGIHQLLTSGLHASANYQYTEQYTKIHRDVRTTALFEGADMAGFLMSLAVVLVITRYATLAKGFWSKVCWFLIPIYIFVLITTIARKSYLATAVALVYMVYSSKKMRDAVLSVMPVLVSGIVVILTGPFSAAIMERLYSFLLPPDQGMPNRLETWEFGIRFWFQSPIIGNGLGAFYQLAYQANSPLVFPHNFYLFILVEFGIVGMAFLFIWGYQLFSSFSKYKLGVVEDDAFTIARGLVAGALVIMLHAGFRSFSLTDPTFWGYFGMCSAFLKVYQPSLEAAVAQGRGHLVYATPYAAS